MTGTDTRTRLSEVLRSNAMWSSVYVDITGGANDPERRGRSYGPTVGERLREAASPQADVDAIESELLHPSGTGGPTSRFVLVRDGYVEVSEVLTGPMLSSEVTAFGRVPPVLPLLRHRPSEFHYLVALVGRDGGELRLYLAGHVSAVDQRDIDGETDRLTKVQAGGRSHARYQHHAEEVWKHNQSEIAAAIDDLVASYHPRVLVLAGDVRAMQLLEEKLAQASREILSKVPVHSRADGASDEALLVHLADRLDRVAEADARNALDRVRHAHGRDGALGIGPVVSALQQSQARVVLIDTQRLSARDLLVLDDEPWIASAPEDAAGASVLGRIDAATAIARAAILTGARIVFTDLLNNGTTLPERAGVAAVLRWSPGPPTPGVQDINS